MKNGIKKAIITMAVVMFGIVFTTNCSNDFSDFDLSIDKSVYDEIAGSQVYNDYLVDYIKHKNESDNFKLKIFSLIKTDGSIFVDSIGKQENEKLISDLKDEMIVSYKNLIKVYPAYESLSEKEKSDLFYRVLNNSDELTEINSDNYLTKFFIRTKGGKNEAEVLIEVNKDKSYFTYFDPFALDNSDIGYGVCLSLGASTGVECGGYVLPDGSCLFLTDPSATDTTMAVVHVLGAPEFFHYHPYSTNLSTDDKKLGNNLKPFGLQRMTIVHRSGSRYTRSSW